MNLITLDSYLKKKEQKVKKLSREIELLRNFSGEINVKEVKGRFGVYDLTKIYVSNDFSLASNFLITYSDGGKQFFGGTKSLAIVDFYFNLEDKEKGIKIPIYCFDESIKEKQNWLYSVHKYSRNTDHYVSSDYEEIKYLNDFDDVFSYYESLLKDPKLKSDFHKYLTQLKVNKPEGSRRL